MTTQLSARPVHFKRHNLICGYSISFAISLRHNSAHGTSIMTFDFNHDFFFAKPSLLGPFWAVLLPKIPFIILRIQKYHLLFL